MLDHGRLVVLDCEIELAAHYTAHAPVPGQFVLQQPYQSPAVTAPVPKHATPQLGTNESGCREAEDDARIPLAASRDGGDEDDDLEAAVLPGQRRKRKRKPAKAPNEAQVAVRRCVCVAASRCWKDCIFIRAAVFAACAAQHVALSLQLALGPVLPAQRLHDLRVSTASAPPWKIE